MLICLFSQEMPKGVDPQDNARTHQETGKVQPHILQLRPPMGKDLNGFVDGCCQKSAGKQMNYRVERNFLEDDEQSTPQSPQTGELGKMGQFADDMFQLFHIGEKLLDKGRENIQHIHTHVVRAVLAGQGVAPDEAKIAQQQKQQDPRRNFSGSGHGQSLLKGI